MWKKKNFYFLGVGSNFDNREGVIITPLFYISIYTYIHTYIHTYITRAKKGFKTGQKRHRETRPATGLVPTGIKSLTFKTRLEPVLKKLLDQTFKTLGLKSHTK